DPSVLRAGATAQVHRRARRVAFGLPGHARPGGRARAGGSDPSHPLSPGRARVLGREVGCSARSRARLDRAWALATGARCRGLLLAAQGDIEGSLESLRVALAHHERVPEPFALARTLYCQGQVLRRAKLKA